MASYQQQKQKVLQLFKPAKTLAEGQKNIEIKQSLEEVEKRLIDEKLFVVVCGEFKQGKSSLMNALLNEPELFTVDVDITTNLVSSITYGETEKITVVLGESGKEKSQEIQRAEIPNYVTEQHNKGNTRQAKMLVLQSPNPQLKEGLVLVDTPGVGSLNVEHTAVTYAFIPNADAIIFVSDALAPLSAKELEFITERIVPYCQNLIFVVTKIDSVANYENIIASNREKLAQVLKLPDSEISIIPVSSRLKLDYLKFQEAEDLEDSNFQELENELWGLISQERGKILLLRALTELGRAVNEIKTPIQVEWETYQQQSKQELEESERQLQATKERLAALQENNADWLTQLNYGLQDIRRQIIHQFDVGFDKVHNKANEYLDNNKLLNNPTEIASLLEGDINGLMSNLGKLLSQQTAELYTNIESASKLNLNPLEIDDLEWDKTDITFQKGKTKPTGLFEKSVVIFRNIGFTATPGATIGYWVGGIAGAAIGALFGGIGAGPGATIGQALGLSLAGLAGAKLGFDQSVSQIKDKDKREVSKFIFPYLKQSQMLCRKVLDDAITDLEQSMREELRKQIKREKNNCDRSLRALQEARQRSQIQVQQRTQELQVILPQINQLQKNIQQLAQATITMGAVSDTKEKTEVVRPVTTVGTEKGSWADD
ncbi:dynamin family protein [Sphaerospermopsis sp. FACHB-1094]|uniref:dynamin family protein n=1 Tax=Sphaerospermopsis sp. FACHB-1094 TaxID=2692861 RepID=UPI00168895FB|nr:dynamin family protein [Sphaerospermopsis sp. FACHB-1094]MBD2134033.1 dynamin family protein [Sphaerospermopsis sp. FACHB-1094]